MYRFGFTPAKAACWKPPYCRTDASNWTFPAGRWPRPILRKACWKRWAVNDPRYVGRGRGRLSRGNRGAGDALGRLAPDMSRLAGVAARGIIVTCRSDSAEFHFLSRFFAPAVGVPEDPVTGSAHTSLGPLLEGAPGDLGTGRVPGFGQGRPAAPARGSGAGRDRRPGGDRCEGNPVFKPPMKLWWRQILWMVGIVALAAGSALVSNAMRPTPLPLIQDWNETLGRRNETLLPDGIPMIDLARMTELYQQENVVVLDARSEVFFELEHIPGAVSLPVEEPDRVPGFSERPAFRSPADHVLRQRHLPHGPGPGPPAPGLRMGGRGRFSGGHGGMDRRGTAGHHGRRWLRCPGA